MLRQEFENEQQFIYAVVDKYFKGNKYVTTTAVSDDLIIQIWVKEEDHKMYIPDTFRGYEVKVLVEGQ